MRRAATHRVEVARRGVRSAHVAEDACAKL